MTPLIINIAIIILEIISLGVNLRKFGIRIFKYYTMLSNLMAAIASTIFLVCGMESIVTIASRYIVTSMLTLTCIIAIVVLIPMGVGLKGILWADAGLFLHLIVPVLSLVSYFAYENRANGWMVILPIAVTLIYGITILILIGKDKCKPPYPFLRIKEQSVKTTVMWVCIVLGMITLIAFVIMGIK